MIGIINTGEQDAEGRFRYRLQVNHTLIAEFYHFRPYGLAACLRLAAKAADRVQREEIEAIVKLVDDEMERLR